MEAGHTELSQEEVEYESLLTDRIFVGQVRRQTLNTVYSFPKWEKERWTAFACYTATLRNLSLPSDKEDLRNLKRFVNDEEEPCHYRWEAAITLSILVCDTDKELAADYLRQALGLMEQVTEEERGRVIPKHNIPDFGETMEGEWTVGELWIL